MPLFPHLLLLDFQCFLAFVCLPLLHHTHKHIPVVKVCKSGFLSHHLAFFGPGGSDTAVTQAHSQAQTPDTETLLSHKD